MIKGMMTSSFATFAQNYAKSMGDKKISVYFGGTEAFTDGQAINLPALPSDVMMTPWEVKVHSGYLDHEIGHVKYTDFKKIFLKSSKEPVLYGLFNLFEDIRIESKMIRNYSGTKEYLDACTQQIEYDKRKKKVPDTLAYKVMEAVYRCCYEIYRDAKIDYNQKETIDTMPKLKKVKKKLEELVGLTSEVGSQKLAKEVAKLLPDLDYSAPSSDLQQLDLKEGEGNFLLLGLLEGKSKGSAGKALEEAVAFIQETSDKTSAVKSFVKDLTSDGEEDNSQDKFGRGDLILPPVGTDKDKIFVPSEENFNSYDQVRTSASTEITSLKRMLQIYLKSRAQKSWERGLPEGKLDTGALADFATGSTDVFKRLRERTLTDTSVQLMVDLSGSMNSGTVKQAAIILAEALNGVPQIKLSIAGFTTNSHEYTGSTGGRAVGLDLKLFKDFEETYMKSRGRLGAISTSGFTPLGEAYAHGFTRLAQRKETRKVLWVITDGQPYFPLTDYRHSEYKLMERVHRRCKRSGIKVVATNVGRVNNDMHLYTDVMKSINSQSDMPEDMLNILKEISQ